MNATDPEYLLREMAEVEEVPDGDLDDATLERYRAGALDTGEATAVEQRLARSPAARARLARLAGVAPAGPSAATRARVLDAFPAGRHGATVRHGASVVTTRRWRRQTWWQPVAAAAALILAIGYCFLPAEPLPSGLAYVVDARGLSTSRGAAHPGPATEATVAALADTVVQMTLTAVDIGAEDVDYGLYRVGASALERIDTDDEMVGEAGTGGAVFRAPARLLVGASPGRHAVIVVAARSGDLPARLTLTPGDDPLAVAVDDGRRRANLVWIELRASAAPTAPPAETR